MTDTCRINSANFSLNDRINGPEDSGQLAFSIMLGHEMRALGKALYVISFDRNPWDENVISGTDTTKLSPVELIVKANVTKQNTRN